MTTIYDVPAKDLIDAVAKKLHEDSNIVMPEANRYSRTGVDRENPPTQKDWWHTRCAAILRKLYIKDVIGVEHLRAEYGGKRDKGSKPYKAMMGSGTIIRRAIQQLEKAGYVTKIKGKGRTLTPKGRSFLDNASNEVMKNMGNIIPDLKKDINV
ncbi:MAG: 30S ribosomal protein S19e [Euryarchaeota archaeon RBG_13_31_8]|nr:MAG: 30S ribosomal protein S19e [Euryarchaeota archaeon RBG_13_31_8]